MMFCNGIGIRRDWSVQFTALHDFQLARGRHNVRPQRWVERECRSPQTAVGPAAAELPSNPPYSLRPSVHHLTI